jgi:hypothetical protein
VERVFQFLQTLIDARGRRVLRGRRAHVDRLVRALFIEAVQERIEAGLLLHDFRGSGMRRFRLQGQMEALVSPVLFIPPTPLDHLFAWAATNGRG